LLLNLPKISKIYPILEPYKVSNGLPIGAKYMTRPDWDAYFMMVAHAVKERADCTRRKVGAILVKDRQIISTGYNGTPSGLKNCTEGGCERCNSNIPSGKDLDKCSCSHAEENTIVQAARHGIHTEGSTMYTTLTSCTPCSKMMINAGIKRIVAEEKYPDDLGTKLLKEAGINMDVFKKQV
jgi:dCMP deaminase